MGSMEANTHPPATSFPNLTATTISSHQLELLQRGLHLQSWGQTSLWYQKPSTGSREKSSLTSLRGVDLPQTNQVVDRTIVLLGLHLKWNRLQWCLSNGMELSDMSGFIGRISYRDYDTFVHTSQLGHFSRLACGQKRVIENHPSRGSLFWFAVGEKDFFFFLEQFKETLSLSYISPLSFLPSFSHIAEKYIMKLHHSSSSSLSDGERGGTDCPE